MAFYKITMKVVNYAKIWANSCFLDMELKWIVRPRWWLDLVTHGAFTTGQKEA